MSSEQEPLLPISAQGIENPNGDESEKASWAERCGEFMESRRFHILVLILIAIDGICVLADLSYTFLNDSCSNGEDENPQWLESLALLSLTITTFFLLEIPLAVYSFGPHFYNPAGTKYVHSGLHFLDACVILVTFVIEVFLRGRERELASLLILFRLWRLVKLVSGVAVGVGESEEPDAKRLVESQAELRAVKERVEKLEKENSALRVRLGLDEAENVLL